MLKVNLSTYTTPFVPLVFIIGNFWQYFHVFGRLVDHMCFSLNEWKALRLLLCVIHLVVSIIKLLLVLLKWNFFSIFHLFGCAFYRFHFGIRKKCHKWIVVHTMLQAHWIFHVETGIKHIECVDMLCKCNTRRVIIFQHTAKCITMYTCNVHRAFIEFHSIKCLWYDQTANDSRYLKT